jgi:hypothetical protein
MPSSLHALAFCAIQYDHPSLSRIHCCSEKLLLLLCCSYFGLHRKYMILVPEMYKLLFLPPQGCLRTQCFKSIKPRKVSAHSFDEAGPIDLSGKVSFGMSAQHSQSHNLLKEYRITNSIIP